MRPIILALALTASAGAAHAQSASLAPPAVPAAVESASEDRRFNIFLDRTFDERARLSPEELTGLGIKERYGELDDRTRAAAERRQRFQEAELARMKRSFDRAKLGPVAQTSWRLFEREVADGAAELRWRDREYVFRANSNPATDLPVFLINQHKVATRADAEAYVARLRAAERVMGQIADELARRAAAGTVAPRFVYAPTIENTRNVLKGAPFGAGPDTALWTDFQTKVRALKLPAAEEAKLIADGRAALTGPFQRGYGRVIAALQATAAKATHDDGVWRLPDGEAYYAHQLRANTTTDLTADQIHRLGLAEVARIHKEMEAIKTKVGFSGTLQDFFREVKTNPKYNYPNTAEGKAAYLKDAEAYIAQVMAKAPTQFRKLPTIPLEVRAVEPWREATASVAFYNQGTPDGSRPGIYYVNLADMRQVLSRRWRRSPIMRARRAITFRSRWPRSRPTCPSCAGSAGTSPIGRAGASTPRRSARRWASTRTR
jgi:uncharacterized protein (DUF885 family)